MTGKEIRLKKFFSNGKPVVIAADHGSYMGPFDGIKDLKNEIMQFEKADAFLVMPGMAKQCKDFFGKKSSPLCIVRVNWAAHYCKPYAAQYGKGCNVKLADVRYAVSLGADVVIASLLLGTDEETNARNVTEFGQIAEEADSLGIPLIGEYIPYGGIDRYSGDLSGLLLGVRACSEFGADLIKTVYVDNFSEVAKIAVVPTLALGGGQFERPSQAFQVASDAISKGAGGVVFGRNVICAARPAAYLDCLIDVVKHGVTPEDAEKKYLNV